MCHNQATYSSLETSTPFLALRVHCSKTISIANWFPIQSRFVAIFTLAVASIMLETFVLNYWAILFRKASRWHLTCSKRIDAIRQRATCELCHKTLSATAEIESLDSPFMFLPTTCLFEMRWVHRQTAYQEQWQESSLGSAKALIKFTVASSVLRRTNLKWMAMW